MTDLSWEMEMMRESSDPGDVTVLADGLHEGHVRQRGAPAREWVFSPTSQPDEAATT